MARHMELILTVKEGNVSMEERNLINVAFSNLVSSKRAALRAICAIEQNPKYAKFNAAFIVYKERI